MPKYNDFDLDLDVQYAENPVAPKITTSYGSGDNGGDNGGGDVKTWRCTGMKYADCIDPQ